MLTTYPHAETSYANPACGLNYSMSVKFMEALLIVGVPIFVLGFFLSFNNKFRQKAADSSLGRWKGAGLDLDGRMKSAQFVYGPGLMFLGGMLIYFYIPWLK
jgi:hypothetical protein